LDQGFSFSDQAERVGAALWSVPLEITRSAAGTEFLIPSPLITSRAVPGPTGHGVSPLFDTRSGQWLQTTTSSRTWMRFQIPKSLLPVDLQAIRMTLQVTAPDRRLQILRLVDGQAEELFAKVNPIGRYERVLTPPELPPVDDAGGIVLGVAVGEMIDSAAERKKAAWKIDFLRLEVSGRIR
jgi:hypothetical protein